MIISLGTQTIASEGQGTYQYNAQSLQKIYFHAKSTSANEAYSYRITVQIGNRTIVNNINTGALALINASQVGGFCPDISATTDGILGINLGSHVCGSETIYVTVNAGNITASRDVQVGLLVNSPVASAPIRLTEFTDSSFASENVLQAYVYNEQGALSTNTIEVRNSSFSTTAPCSQFVVANASDGFIDQVDYDRLGKLMDSSIPLSTTFNNSTGYSIVCVGAMENSPQMRMQARRQARAVNSVLTPSEQRAR